MPEQVKSGVAPGQSGELAELREELHRSREEVLRLRDLLIARDAELGAARGRLAELEDTAGRLISVFVRIGGLRGLLRAGINRLRGLAERHD
jgi:hypothetical protein